MWKDKKTVWIASLIFSILVLLPVIHSTTVCAEYPTKTIECIIPWPAGTASDIAIRMICKFAEKELGKPIAPINMVGGNCEVAWNHLRKSKPDGYTIGLVTMTVVENQAMGSEIKCDSFDYLLQFTHQPIGLFVLSDTGWKTMEDFAQAAKARPGEISVAITAFGATLHQMAFLLEKKYGIKLNPVPIGGSAKHLAQLLGKHIDGSLMTFTKFAPYMRNGTVNMLMTFSDKRLQGFPDVPNIKELGISDVGLESWRTVGIPKGVPKPIQNTLKTAFKKAYTNPEYQALAKRSFFDLLYREHDGVLKFAGQQLLIFKQNLKEMGYLK